MKKNDYTIVFEKKSFLCCHCAVKKEKSEHINKLMSLMYGSYTCLNEKRPVCLQ